MRRVFLIVIVLILVAPAAIAVVPFSYEIEVELDPEQHTLRGREKIRWTNSADAATDELWFHLYLNAFANRRTTFMRGMGSGSLRSGVSMDRHWGWIRITSLKTVTGADLLPSLTFERPDDGNPEDFTVARVVLPEPVLPASAVEVELSFEAQLPRVLARTGWAGDYHLVGQWFPKLGVFEASAKGGRGQAGWNCHQFHPASEFYADFATYRVHMTVPDDFVLGATGIELERRETAAGTARKTIYTYMAERVHDFAWCAAPASMMDVVEADFDPARDVPPAWLERATQLLDLSAADLELPPMHIRLLRPKSQAALTDRMLRGARLGIAWYGLFYGAYPYPQLTVVMPPPGAEESGGMEYPTFITSLSSKLLEYPPLSWIPLGEVVTIHEFGHQYFQGLVASNEFEQAWLDEGLNSYAEAACMAAIRDDDLLPGRTLISAWAGKRLQWAFRETPLKIDRKAWEYRSRSDYGLASYAKTALVMKTLEGLLGPEVFARAMRRYALDWRFHHPTGRDLVESLSQSSGEELQWFFDQAVRSDEMVDWAVGRVRQRRPQPMAGLQWTGSAWEELEDSESEDVDRTDDPWSIRVEVARQGEFVGPVDTLLIFADGREERRTWDGEDRWVRYELESPNRLAAVVVDPDGVWALEGERRNNYWRDEPEAGGSRERVWWVSSLLRSFGFVLTPWS